MFEPTQGQLIGNRYRLVRDIARGGMGSVWLATHEQLDAPVAVKFMATELDSTLIARFEREAKACARLASPHVVRVHDFGSVDNQPYMVMELLEGEDLSARLKRVRRLPMEQLLPISAQISKGLIAAHDAGIVHRDLKPANVFLARAGRDEIVKLLDFGIARETNTKMVEEMTTTGIVLGSPHHMSPEQASGESVDRRSDLWSFGVLLYQALTGSRPFGGSSMTAVVYAIATQKAKPPTELGVALGPGIDRFFEKAFEREPDARFQSAEEMFGAFLAVVQPPRAPVATNVEAKPLHEPATPAPAPSPVTATSSPTGPSSPMNLAAEFPLPYKTPTPLTSSSDSLAASPDARSYPSIMTGSQVFNSVSNMRRVEPRKGWWFVAPVVIAVAIMVGAFYALRGDEGGEVTTGTGLAATTKIGASAAVFVAPTLAALPSAAPSASASSIVSTSPVLVTRPTAKRTSTPPLPQTAVTTTPTQTGPCPAGKKLDKFGLCVSK